jgi:membrane protease YdiL (CAAX protease family)
MMTIKAFMTRHPVVTYFALAFAISWGGLLTVVGLGGFIGKTAEPTNTQLPFVFLAMFGGPTVAGLLLTGLVDGTTGFRELRSRLLRWQVGARWYAVAVLTAPLLMMVTLFALSLTNRAFLPGIFVSEGNASLVLTSIVAGLMTGFCEELGWTGFAVPRLRLRGGVLATGLIVGLLWGGWHFPLFSGGDSSGVVPPVLFVPGLLFTVLPAFRVLMVWVYDRTGSLLVTMLMHASLTASTLILQPAIAGVPAMTYNLVLAAAVYVVIAAVAMANGGQLSRQPLLRSRAA